MKFHLLSTMVLDAVTAVGDAETKIPLSEKLTVGVQTFFLGMGTVFAVLIILWFLIWVIGKAVASFEGKKQAAKPVAPVAAPAEPEPEPEVEEGIGEEELVAVMAAAIAAYGGENAPRMKIRSVRRAR